MLAIDIGHYRENRRKLEERTVAFVRLGHQILRFTQPRVGAHRVHASTDNDRGVKPAGGEHRSHHRSGGGLAMHAADGDAVLQPHQFGEHLGALNYGNVALVSSGDFYVVAGDG